MTSASADPHSTHPRNRTGGVETRLAPDEVRALAQRLRRAQGQIGGVVTMVEEGRDCTDVVYQLAAAKKALDRAGYVLLESLMRHCVTETTEPATDAADLKTLQQLFLRLS